MHEFCISNLFQNWNNLIKYTKHCNKLSQYILYLGGSHKLLPMSLADGWVLELGHGAQRGQHVLDSVFNTSVCIPGTHLLV